MIKPCAVALILLIIATTAAANAARKLTVLISIDAFQYDFLHRDQCKFLANLANQGGYAAPLLSQFPSYTFPNHYTLMTGLRPEHHGILANSFYDARLDKTFKVGRNDQSPADQIWWKAEPLFITACRQKRLKTATLFWPGDNVFNHPLHRKMRYEDTWNSDKRVNQLLAWLDEDPDLDFVQLYLNVVDRVGHVHGPDSVEMDMALQEVNDAVESLVVGLDQRKIWKRTNLVIVSDHGLSPARSEHPPCMINLGKFVPSLNSSVQWMDYHRPVSTIHVKKGKDASKLLADIRKAIRKYNLPMEAYWTRQLQRQLRIDPNSPRVGQLIVMANEGCTFGTWRDRFKKQKGFHGYDPFLRSMQGLFLAYGPDMSANSMRHLGQTAGSKPASSCALKNPKPVEKSEEFWNNLEVYPFLCRLLDIPGRAHDGTNTLADWLLPPQMDESSSWEEKTRRSCSRSVDGRAMIDQQQQQPASVQQ